MTQYIITFIAGTPIPEGSMHGYWNSKKKYVVLVHNNQARLNKWRKTIAKTVQESISDWRAPTDKDRKKVYSVSLIFSFKRKKTNRNPFMTIAPDLDKLIRAVLDALTGTVWYDDSQVNKISAEKQWCLENDEEGVLITVYI